MTDNELQDWRATTSAGVQQRLMAVTEPEVMDNWLAMNERAADALHALLDNGVRYEDAVGMIVGSVAASLAQHRPLFDARLGEA